jgi:hypothetical protein
MVQTTKKEYISQPQSATNMPGGQKEKKAKHNHNISGLKNQSRNLPSHSDSKQQDMIIPQSNPNSCYCRQPQSMTTPSGEAKGLKQVLEE